MTIPFRTGVAARARGGPVSPARNGLVADSQGSVAQTVDPAERRRCRVTRASLRAPAADGRRGGAPWPSRGLRISPPRRALAHGARLPPRAPVQEGAAHAVGPGDEGNSPRAMRPAWATAPPN